MEEVRTTVPHAMSFDLKKNFDDKRRLRRELAARPIEEKLRMLDALRERELTIRGRANPLHPRRSMKHRRLLATERNECEPWHELSAFNKALANSQGQGLVGIAGAPNGIALMSEETTRKPEVYHRFLDETGDTTFYGKGRKLIVGQDGVSLSFGLGVMRIDRSLKEVRQEVCALEKQVEAD
jgi:hypothetical protein